MNDVLILVPSVFAVAFNQEDTTSGIAYENDGDDGWVFVDKQWIKVRFCCRWGGWIIPSLH